MSINQGKRQEFFRAISGTTTDYNGDFLAAAATESFTGEFNGVFVQWLQDRTGSSATNIDGLKQEFAELAGAHNWESTGGVPIILEGCQLWLDASDSSTITESGDAVSQWGDKSGGGFNITQGSGSLQPLTNQNTIGGLNTITFDGSNDQLVNSAYTGLNEADGYEIFIVCKPTTTSLGGFIAMAQTGGNHGLVTNAGTAYRFLHRMPYGNTGGDNILAGSVTLDAQILEFERDITGNNQAIIKNGVSLGTTAITDVAFDDIMHDLIVGGQQLGVTINSFEGDMGEIICYNRALSTSERLLIRTYLSNKWGVAVA